MTSFSNFKSQLVSASTVAAGIELGGGTSSYADVSELPESPSQGDMALITSTNKLYVYNGAAWFNIAIVNQAPTAISGSQANYTLANDGTPTVVTLVSTDPEGFPLTWSATTSGDSQVGTLTQADNVFTVTPSTDEADIGTLSVTFSVTDGNNTETSVSSFILAFTSSLWYDTLLSIGTSSTNSLDNSTFIDRSTNAHTVTTSGTPIQTAFHPYLDNWSVEFDGTSYLYNSTDNLLGSGDFTIEAWVYPTQPSVTTSTRGIVSQYPNEDSAGTVWIFGMGNNSGSGTHLRVYYNFGAEISTTAEMNLNQWNHIAWTREGGTNRLFVNGILDTTFTSSADYSTNTYNTEIGTWNTTLADRSFIGNISNLRIINGTALYTSTFTPPTEKLTNISGTQILACQSNRFVFDGSYDPSAWSIGGNPKISAFNPFGQESEYTVGENKGSGYFDGNGDYLTVANTSAGAFGTDDFTLEFWIYNIANASSFGVPISSYNGINTQKHWSLHVDRDAEGNIYWYSSITVGINSSVKLNKNSWTHIAVARSSGTTTMYVNGVSGGSFSDSTNYVTPNGIAIGSDLNSPSSFEMMGNISNLRIIKGTAVYTTNFTPPTAPVGNTNASLYLSFDNAGIFDKTGNHTLTLVGDTATSTTQTKFANTAMYFDGNDWISWNPPSIGSGDFTMEGWFYLSGTAGQGSAGQQGIFCAGNHGGSSKYSIKLHNTTPGVNKVMGFWLNSYTNEIRGSTVINTNQWYHYALVRSGSGSNNVKLYLDGTLEAQTTSTYSIPADTGSIGRNYPSLNAEYFNGYLENIQLLPGIAKYTTNFTPPTREQGRTYQAES